MSAMDGLSIDEIAGDLIKKELFKVIEKRLDSDKIQMCIEHGSKKGDNFQGEVYRVLFKHADNDDEHRRSLFLKVAPSNLSRRERSNLRNVYLGEIRIYDEVLQFFDDFQLSKGIVPTENGFHEYPKSYHSISEELSESLFLEDLDPKQFEMINLRKEELTFDHMSLYLKALGKFHAISFAIKDQQPEKFKQLAEPIEEKFWSLIDSLYVRMINDFTDCLKEENRLDLLEKVKRVIGNDAYTAAKKLAADASAEKYAVICHGDLTVKNSMFRRNAEGKPIEFRMFDWQYTRCASPVTDLIVYLLCCTTKEVRDAHFDDFLRIYHESLSDLMKRLGSDPQKIFPFEELLDQLRKFGTYAIFFGAILLPMLFADIEALPNFDEYNQHDPNQTIFQISNDSKKAYNKRVVDMFVDMDRLGYI